jgi:hypothetical protein
MDRSYLGEVDVEEERLLGAGHLNPVPGAGLLLLRVAARLHRRHRRLVAVHVGADQWTGQSEGLLVSRDWDWVLRGEVGWVLMAASDQQREGEGESDRERVTRGDRYRVRSVPFPFPFPARVRLRFGGPHTNWAVR